ncbi:MAG: hypothetical protein CMJ76_15825 [Planctomycetaceae bacterium]|nr:hypothetical protein [Planctomycetaceae bacterium]
MFHTVITGILIVFTLPLAAAETINSPVGTGNSENNGDTGTALSINIGQPFGVDVGPNGAMYITVVENHRIIEYSPRTGKVRTVAGNGRKGLTGDGGLATDAALNEPYEVRFAANGDMFFVEMKNHLVRKVDARTKVISTIAGTGVQGYSGDGGSATNAMLNNPHSITLDDKGNLYIADIGNHRIRKVHLTSGMIHSIAGNTQRALPKDGQLAKGNSILGPRALFYRADTLWIALREGHSVWRLDLASGRLQHIAGTGTKGYSGDGGIPSKATFDGPKGIVVDKQGRIFVVDTENHAIRMIDLSKNEITTVAGNGDMGFTGDGGPATSATMDRPHGIGIDLRGRIYVGDTNNHVVRVFSAPE